MAYPTGAEFSAWLTNIGFEDVPTDADRLMSVAIDKFEKRTGWQPFLAVEKTKTFQFPANPSNDGWRVDMMDDPFLSVSLVKLVRWKDLAEFTLANRTQYSLLPLSGGEDENPYFALRIFDPKYAAFQGEIRITGMFGYTTTLPEIVKDCLFKMAALEMFVSRGINTMATTGGREIKRTKVGSTEIEYAEQASIWEKSIDLVIKDVAKWL